LMHAPPGEVQLLQVPFVPWVSYFPGLEPLLRQTPQERGEARYHYLDHNERTRCAQVWSALTARQREVLSAFAAGHQRQTVADQLVIDIKTVDSHREAIAQECSKVWGLDQELRFDTRFLRERFGPFLAGQSQV
jgi:CRISPR-associated protein Csx14